MKYIFGPVASRRFGVSLGIDLSPDRKSCNFDCLYCELKKDIKRDKIENAPKVKDIISELKEALEKFKNIDVITITANGEPTLYENLNKLIDEINSIKGKSKSLILSNSSTIYKKDIQESLKKLDIVKLSLDCISKEVFKKIDRPIDLNIEDIINGIINFRENFKNQLVIEILFVKDINDKEDEVKKINEVLNRIKPDRVDLSSVDRPPAYSVQGIDYNEILELSKSFTNLNINIASHKNRKKLKQNFTENYILNTISKRPLSEDDIDSFFDKTSKDRLYLLLKNKRITLKNIAGVKFFVKN